MTGHPRLRSPGVVRLGTRLIRARPGAFTLTALLWVSWWSVPALAGLALRAVFDAVAGQAPAGLGVAELAAIYLVIEAGRGGLFVGAVTTWARWFATATALLRLNLLDAQLASGGPGAAPPVADAGAGVSVFRDDAYEFGMWVDTWLDAGGVAVFAVVATAVMVRVDAVVTVVVVAPLVAAFAVNRWLTPRLRRYRRADRQATQEVTGFLGGVFAAALALKVAGAETAAVARLRGLNGARRRTALRDRLLADGLDAANASVVDLTIGLVLLLVAGSMRAGTFSVGDLALFTTYVAWLAGVPRWFGLLLARHRHAQVAAERMAALGPAEDPGAFAASRRVRLSRYAPPPPVVRAVGAAPAEVSVRGLVVRHPDGAVGISGVDLDLPAGGLVIVTGPVGSGKTTLLRGVLGRAQATAGQVRWNGRPVRDLACWMIPPRAAWVAQAPVLFTESLRDNLALGAALDDDAVWHALRVAVLDADVAGMPAGLDTTVGARGVRLSGGQVQRAAAARALLAQPELLVVDDVSSALDVATEHQLWARLRRETAATVLAVSHRRVAIELADEVVVLDAGRVVARGPYRALRGTRWDPLADGARPR